MKNIMRLLTRTKCHNKAYPIPTQSTVLNLVPRKFSTSINMTINPYLQLQSKIYPVKFNVNTLQAFILYLEMKLLKCNLLRFPFFFYQATNQFPSMHLKMKIVLANGACILDTSNRAFQHVHNMQIMLWIKVALLHPQAHITTH